MVKSKNKKMETSRDLIGPWNEFVELLEQNKKELFG